MMHDLNQAIAILDTVKHWVVKSVNRDGQRKAHECTIWTAGYRVTGQARTPLAAIVVAWKKLAEARKEEHPVESDFKVVG